MLRRVLAAVAEIELGELDPSSVEVVVVDNAPDGEARSICQEIGADLPFGLRFVEEAERGISCARNAAVRAALNNGADFIAFIDDDDYPDPDWLLQLIEQQSETGADIVGGAWRFPIQAALPDWLAETPLFSKWQPGRFTYYGVPRGMGTFNVLLSRQILERLGSEGPVFAHEFSFTGGGDRDLFIRAKKRGASFTLASRSVVNRDFEPERLTLAGAIKRAFRFGASTITMARRHGPPGRARRRTIKALGKLVLIVVMLPMTIFSRRLLIRNLCKLSREAGIIYRSTGGRYQYYTGAS